MLDKLKQKAFKLIGCEPASGNHIGGTKWTLVSGLVETLMKDYVLEWRSNNKLRMWGAGQVDRLLGFSALEKSMLNERFVTFEEYKMLFDVRVPEDVSKKLLHNLFLRYPVFVLADIHNETQRQKVIADYTEDLEGYLLFMKEKNETLWTFFNQWNNLRFPLSELDKHLYMVGMTGCGKTEIFKALIIRYVIEGNIGGLVIDLDGDFAQQVAMFKENAEQKHRDRLIYIYPFLDKDLTPVINPFDLPNKKQFFNEVMYTEVLEQRASQIQQALVQIFKDFEGSFTDKMEGFLYPAICVTLLNENGDLNELLRLFDEERNHDLIALGKKSPNSTHRQRFESGFTMPKETRDGIKNRLSQMLDRGSFRNLVSGKSTIDLKSEIEAGKLIIFHIPKRIGIKESMYFGKFVFAIVASAMFERSEMPEHARKPFFVFVDEFQNIVNDDFKVFLNQARKFKGSLNLASQTIGQEMTTMVKQAVGGNTFIKIGGQSNDPKTIDELANYFATKSTEVEKIPKHIFKVRVGKCMPFIFHPTTTYLNTKHSMDADSWKLVKEEQLSKYYRIPHKVKPTEVKDVYSIAPENLPKDLQPKKATKPKAKVPKTLPVEERVTKHREQKEITEEKKTETRQPKKPFTPKYR